MKVRICKFLLSLVVLAGLLIPASACQSLADELTILHTNDTHAHLDNIARRATAIDQVRREVGAENCLLCDAGDVFEGTPYYNLYKGQADLWFMNKLGYDAMSLGNHEFDDLESLSGFISGAQFPVLCANFDFSNDNGLDKKPVAWTILKKGGQEYGVLGLTTEETAEISTMESAIQINDSVTAAKKAVEDLENKGINKIIAITHLGWQKDLDLAREVEGIDVIVGGHSHTVPDTYPTIVTEDNTPTLVVQAGEIGQYLGRLNISFDQYGVIRSWRDSRLITIDENTPEDAVCSAKMAEYQQPLQALLNTVVGKTLVTLDGEPGDIRSKETNLGDLVADSMLAKASGAGATIAIVNSGGIRVSVPAGDITLGKVREVEPFDNYLVVIDVTGQQIKEALENGVSQVEDLKGRFPQVSGLRFTWDPLKPVGSRILSVDIKTNSGYQPIDVSAQYRVALNNYMREGGDGYTVFQNGSNFTNVGFVDYEVLADYIQTNSPLNPQVEGRIISQSDQ